MVGDYIRISFQRKSSTWIVEYGEMKLRGLSPEEQEEYDGLNKDLMGFQDFATAEDLLEDDRREIMDKKKRLEELDRLREEESIVWITQKRENIESILLILEPNWMPTYVENLSHTLLQKLLEPQFTLNVLPGLSVESLKKEKEESKASVLSSENPTINEVLQVLNGIKEESKAGVAWTQLVEITEYNPAEGQLEGFTTVKGTIYVMPIKFLQDDWGPINIAIKNHFGTRQSWHRAKAFSYWAIRG